MHAVWCAFMKEFILLYFSYVGNTTLDRHFYIFLCTLNKMTAVWFLLNFLCDDNDLIYISFNIQCDFNKWGVHCIHMCTTPCCFPVVLDMNVDKWVIFFLIIQTMAAVVTDCKQIHFLSEIIMQFANHAE